MFLLKKALKWLAYILGFFLVTILIAGIYIWWASDRTKPPVVTDMAATELSPVYAGGSLYTIDNNWIRKNQYGLYEMYVSGDAFERGVKNGKLSKQLVVEQERAFTAQIKQMIPSDKYLKFLKYIIGVMNKDLPDHVLPEYQQEIYGISMSASDSFKWIGENYNRILNYHAAHDIGHALQNMMLVGCTSFGAWDTKTEDGSLLLGRNFDFWVGDRFAENKIVAFYKPAQGHGFMFVTWGGFTGVVSGMNDQGLTVTINAAKSKIPWSGAATPVSLVAREILQYAGNINEAITIAKKRKMFVSESFLIGSARDHKAITIEKTPDGLNIYDPNTDNIQCTNHYQSTGFANNELNREQMDRSASVYRYQRLQELVKQQYPLNPQKIALILRDRRGLGGADIGEGNEKAINQLIAHHSVIFQPDSLRMWVSSNPWQLGAYVCYDLKKILAMNGMTRDMEIADTTRTIAADPFLQTQDYSNFLLFRQNKLALLAGQAVDTAQVVHSNPHMYDAYRIAGDYSKRRGWYKAAISYYKQALQYEVATVDERDAIQAHIAECEEKLKH